jgi:hypothetical protein
MRKTIFIILITMLAFGLMFGCTNETNNAPENNDTGDVVTQPNNNTNNGAGPVDEIPMPPALPE